MSGAVSFAFALGLLSPLAPAGISWALASIGLSVNGASERALGQSLRAALFRGAVSGLGLALVMLLGAALYELEVGVADAFAIPSLLLSASLLAFGCGLAYRPGGQARRPSKVALIAFAVSYGVISMAGTAGIVHRLLERSAEQGAAGLIGGAVLLIAGAATALAVLFSLGALASKALRSMHRAFGAALVVAGGVVSVIYWLPGARGDVDDPGSGFGEALAGISRNVGEAIAGNLLIPAIFFLAAAAWAALQAARPRRV